MPTTAPFEGVGTTITFAGFTARIVAWNHSGISAEIYDVTHAGSTTGQYDGIDKLGSTLVDGGEIDIEIQWDPSEEPPIGGAAQAFTIAFPGGGSVTGSGIGKEINYRGGAKQVQTGNYIISLVDVNFLPGA